MYYMRPMAQTPEETGIFMGPQPTEVWSWDDLIELAAERAVEQEPEVATVAENIIRYVAALPQDQVDAAVAEQPCVGVEQVMPMLGCFTGTPPPGVNVDAATFNAFCLKMMAAGFFEKPGCPDVEEALRAFFGVPACQDQLLAATTTYCGAAPTAAAGPDPAMNAACWLGQLAPAYYAELRGLVPCTPPAAPTAEEPTRVSIPRTTAITEEQREAIRQTLRAEAEAETPVTVTTTLPGEAPPPGEEFLPPGEEFLPPGEEEEPEVTRAGLSTRTLVVGGVIAVAAVGGIMLFRRRK